MLFMHFFAFSVFLSIVLGGPFLLLEKVVTDKKAKEVLQVIVGLLELLIDFGCLIAYIITAIRLGRF